MDHFGSSIIFDNRSSITSDNGSLVFLYLNSNIIDFVSVSPLYLCISSASLILRVYPQIDLTPCNISRQTQRLCSHGEVAHRIPQGCNQLDGREHYTQQGTMQRQRRDQGQNDTGDKCHGEYQPCRQEQMCHICLETL